MQPLNRQPILQKTGIFVWLLFLLNSGLLFASGTITLTGNAISENQPSGTFIGTIFVDQSSEGIHFTIHSPAFRSRFSVIGDSLFSLLPFNYEADSVYHVPIYAWLGNIILAENTVPVHIKNLQGKFDQNGIADADVAAIYPQVQEGDFLFLEPNVGTNNLFFGQGIQQLSYPARIWVRADEYDEILINLDSIEGNSPSERIIISNLEGQVKARKVLIQGGKFWRLTGQASPSEGIGHPAFPGCDSDSSSVDFGGSSGHYGWWISNGYTSDEIGLQIYGKATGFEVDHIEISDGGFAGLMMKSEDGTEDMEDVHLHHLYIHDVGGEGMYIGSTNPDPQHQINHLTVEYCALLRTGAEALQAGQLGPGCIIRNNVLWGGMIWMDPFSLHQDHGMQVAIRNGGTLVENNIIMGAGNAFFNIRMNPHDGIQPNNDSLIFRNNLGWQCRGPLAAYMGQETNSVTPVMWKENYFGDFTYDYDRVYLTRPASDHLIRVASIGVNVTFWDNVNDDSEVILYERWGADGNFIDLGNHQAALPAPAFKGFPDENFLDWKYYANQVGNSIDFPEMNTKKGEFITFQPGEIVGFPDGSQTKYYRCKQVAQNHPPVSGGDEFWELLIWVNGQDTSYIPADDVRLLPESFYAQRGMGLERRSFERGTLLLNQDSPIETKTLKVSPNPSTGRININPPVNQEGLLNIYSSDGQHISGLTLPSGGAELDLGTQAPGIYLITLTQGNERYSTLVLIR